MLGIVALSGIVVNDSLVLISQAVHLEKTTDLEPKDIIKAAGIQRFRPIILTTLTTFFGLAPMILETSRQARMLIPMAVSIGFGILFATLITLVLIPSLYLVINDCKRCWKSLITQL
jgi:multidrug efflux pump subunit AcrB